MDDTIPLFCSSELIKRHVFFFSIFNGITLAYYHPLFQRDNPKLCSQMTCINAKSSQQLQPMDPVALGLGTGGALYPDLSDPAAVQRMQEQRQAFFQQQWQQQQAFMANMMQQQQAAAAASGEQKDSDGKADGAENKGDEESKEQSNQAAMTAFQQQQQQYYAMFMAQQHHMASMAGQTATPQQQQMAAFMSLNAVPQALDGSGGDAATGVKETESKETKTETTTDDAMDTTPVAPEAAPEQAPADAVVAPEEDVNEKKEELTPEPASMEV